MSLDPKAMAALAISRFGFGARAGNPVSMSGDPRGALIAELDRPDAGRIADDDLMSSGEAARAVADFRRERKAARMAERMERDARDQLIGPPAPPDVAATEKTTPDSKPNAKIVAGVPQQIYLDEAKARFDAALNAEIGFAERLVWFWSNHFCISADKGGVVRALAGPYERAVIRAHALGRFGDMLLAAESHPAMLIYLDNARSIGPASIAGRRQGKGLNENLAREIMELHTLGVRTGYSQDDVTSFAKVITGWTLIPPNKDPERGGAFVFNGNMHEPGAQIVVGTSYPDTGVEQGRAVLAALARHPATARHLAGKLARHFVADEPPSSLVEKLTRRFLDTDGDLKAVAKALVEAPESWSAPRTKLKSPAEWTISAMRASGAALADVRRVINTLNILGEPLWRPPAPKGFPDDEGSWLDGVAQRLDIANELARRVGGHSNPRELSENEFGALFSDETRQTIARAESRPQALALLLMAPEFQRR